MNKFENLIVWKKSVYAIKKAYLICSKLPTVEDKNIKDQLRRAVTSISLNIAEGSASQNDVEFTRYLRIAQKSAHEVFAILKIIEALYKVAVQDLENEIEEIMRMLAGLIRSLKNQK
jgi:four helix bundle protein